MGEASVVKQAALWAVGVVIGLLAITFVLRTLGVERPSLAPEQLVGGAV